LVSPIPEKEKPMKGFAVALLVLASLAGSACGSSGHGSVARTPTPIVTTRYTAILTQLNHSGVSGQVDFQLGGNILVVIVNVKGLVPNQKHFQHIHGDGASSCPSVSEANSSVSLSEALTTIGPLAFDMQPYPVTDSQGRLNVEQTFTLASDELASITPMTGHVMVFHGAMNHGVYDRFLPAACGDIQAV
jgi:hypothetical protein